MRYFYYPWMRCVVAACSLALCPVALPAQTEYPARTVRTVLPYGAGSGPDAVMRHVGEILSRDWSQPFVIENKPGANG